MPTKKVAGSRRAVCRAVEAAARPDLKAPPQRGVVLFERTSSKGSRSEIRLMEVPRSTRSTGLPAVDVRLWFEPCTAPGVFAATRRGLPIPFEALPSLIRAIEVLAPGSIEVALETGVSSPIS